MKPVDVAFTIAALTTWLFTAVNGFAMLRYRDRSRSLWWFACNGYAFYTGAGFHADVKPWRHRFLAGALTFLLVCVAWIFRVA